MCGIFGHFSFDKTDMTRDVIRSLGDIINYRGPDGQGIYFGDGVAIGNQRLAIIDVEGGSQPFYSDDGNVVVVQNGEIFNHIELAEELSSTEFSCKTHSDTEVILNLYLTYGIEFVNRLNGMFAIAIYDARIDELFIIRDRVGEKPLYFYQDAKNFIFASEIKSILNFPIKRELNLQALDSYLAYNYVPAPLTMFEGVVHMLPGTYVKVSSNGLESYTWWRLDGRSQNDVSEEQWVERFNETIDDAVRLRLRSDVPFGAFLSGGVDSSTVVGFMAKHLACPVKTFSIGFNEEKYDESPFALEAALRFSTEHECEKVSPNLLSYWDKVIFHCDQPHGDVSFIPTLKVAELASKKVKMVLTGDGADELFAGYDKYRELFESTDPSLPDDDFFDAFINTLSLFSEESRVRLLNPATQIVTTFDHTRELISNRFFELNDNDRINKVLYVDTMLLLSGNNLVKPDRMGMAVSIENRSPFLDYRMIELAFSMPGSMKLKNGETKYIYKKAVSPLIGENLTYRKKQMFTVPIGEWLKHELKDMVYDLLLSEKAKSRNLFDYKFVQSMYEEHCKGECNYTREIRALMALEVWFRQFLPDYRYEA
ncbi:asparagine synthase (glutamine-hydrolyzing) [Shewanella khirikhana]|uniref:asparagine synthase (glutamine-hydrolyzing) n=1 Tax=Shewanella khirikhana TaxID=1965282 RepID=A0ABM7DB44_9GAMM|nr:asparagine synthase (glutamine-hydrolyzing) [Shewanella khirikhana]AZQ11100.1 Asparagine synthetase [glutamine-hydrolyzing] 1 [Shewanella khirikhana]